jgi:hypothetical protein
MPATSSPPPFASPPRSYLPCWSSGVPARRPRPPPHPSRDHHEHGKHASTAAPTTTGNVACMSEGAWFNAITKVQQTIDKPFTSSINMTRAKMVELENTLRACSRELARIGSPSHRLQPVYVLGISEQLKPRWIRLRPNPLPAGTRSRLLPDGDVLGAVAGERLALPVAPALAQRHPGEPRHQVELRRPCVAKRH